MGNFFEEEQLQQAMWEFKLEAARQLQCAVTGDKADDWHAHHVVEKAELKRMGLPKLKRYDRRNALRLKASVHLGTTAIPMTCLTNDNLEYAFEVLGVRAIYYLQSHYEGTDPRFEKLAAEYD
jgi:hypothetical protein